MSKKAEQQVQQEPQVKKTALDILFAKQEKQAPIYDAVLFISDEGSSGKSTAAIALTLIKRAMGETIDLYVCDNNHKEAMEALGQRDETGELLGDDQQTPDHCAFFNIRTDSDKMIDRLSSPSKRKFFDLPSDSIDELLKIFGDAAKFLKAFEKTRTRLTFAVPCNTMTKSLPAVIKLFKMFVGVNPNVEVRFALIYNHSIIKIKSKNEGGKFLQAFNNDPEIIKLKNTVPVIEQHITAHIESRFINILDDSVKNGESWFEIYHDLELFDQMTMQSFLEEYIELANKL
ncbi:hypothetical protein F7R25_03900 [Burkholderia stagnalis]|uniref:Uncharacterized protein n=1 Tax=Burkholderia stagnalis TaxID=1503054 RepID=A0A6L3N3Q2_9BURK|nr:hypothetical protein [Burkholderia stagnalis]KAB0640648.1 hypothetical protein F7R25_03900 [Burkholderia stagnalis]VWB05965.1 hypothetical protein BST28156_00094 [Burkholderia stagnalis]